MASAETSIQKALFVHMGALPLDPALRIAFPNDNFPGRNDADGTLNKKPDTYLEAILLPNRNDDPFVGNDDTVQHVGILQITVLHETGRGTTTPRRIADEIATHFAKGTKLYADGIMVRIYKKPSLAPAVQDDTHVRLPLSIPYRSFV